MRARTQLPSHLSFGTTLALTVLVAVAMVITACSSSVQPNVQPPPTPKTTKVYTCKDRPIKIDKIYTGKGVDKDPVVACTGVTVSWSGPKGWKVSFTTSPFASGVTDIDEATDPTKLVTKDVGADDVGFKYSVTFSDGTKFDPQIIIMGGS
jgi:hypothetical protein